jgi:hypothetical protein
MMFKRRIAAVEKRIAVLGAIVAKKPHLIFCFGDETISSCEKDEARDGKNGPCVVKTPRPSLPDAECVLRFDFDSDENQIGRAASNEDDVADISHPTEGRNTQK